MDMRLSGSGSVSNYDYLINMKNMKDQNRVFKMFVVFVMIQNPFRNTGVFLTHQYCGTDHNMDLILTPLTPLFAIAPDLLDEIVSLMMF